MIRDPLSGMPMRLRVLFAAVTAAGMLALVVASTRVAAAAPVSGGRLAACALLVGLADLAVLHLRFGGERYSFTWSEAALLVGLVLMPPPYLVLIVPVSVAIVHAAAGRPVVKIVYNAMAVTIATATGRLAAGVINGDMDLAHNHGVRWYVALVAAAIVFSAVSTAATAAAVAWSQNGSVGAVLRRGWSVTLSVLAGNTVVALLLLRVTWNAATVATVPLLVGLLYAAYRGWLSAREERDTWRELEDASKHIAALDVDTVATAAAERLARIIHADAVDLYVRPPDRTEVHRYAFGRGDAVTRTAEPVHVLDAMALRSGIIVRSSEEADDRRHDSGSLPHALTMQLDRPDSTGTVGALRLRFRGTVTLSNRERQVLLTFGRSVATSIDNAQRYERMRAAAARHEHDATHDTLTGLPNRVLLLRRLAAALDQCPAGRSVALLIVDLDHFKQINDTLGHPTGDRLLQAASERLQSVVRSSDVIARLGGDEFAVLLTEVRASDDVDGVARTLTATLASPVTIDGLRLSVDGSVGMSVYPDDARSVEELLSHADIALYQAKTTRGTSRRYSAERDETSVSRLTVAAELRGALATDELVLHFQPQYRLSDGALTGAEALVRWDHPQRGMLPPSEFVSVAEDSGLVHEFTRHLLSKAVREAATWRDLGSTAHVAVNLSARNLLEPDLAEAVAAVLARHDLPADRLVLEITETTMMSELDVVEATLADLRRLGVQLSVDDFGTGYSSLTFLTRTAVNELKIDREFVAKLLVSDSDAAIVRATLDLAHGLGLRAVAEGVEDAETLEALRTLGCDAAQGYHLGRPMSAEELRQRLVSERDGGVVQLVRPRESVEPVDSVRPLRARRG